MTDTLFPLPAPREPDSVAAITERLTAEVEALLAECDGDDIGVPVTSISGAWDSADAVDADRMHVAAIADMLAFRRAKLHGVALRANIIANLAQALGAALAREGIRRG